MGRSLEDKALADLGVRPTTEDPDWRKQELRARLFGERSAPTRIGRYIVLGTLGSGGMGSVLRAYDETLDRQLALKLMHPGVQSHHQKRILREAQALARLAHPNVVHVYEVGEVDNQLFIAMELVTGQTLQKWQEAGRTWQECLDVYIQAGRGLVAAHAAGMIHRDFKPSNCIRDEEGRVRVLDFGLARHSGIPEDDEEPEPEPTGSSSPPVVDSSSGSGERVMTTSSSMLSKKLTVTGSVLGTVAYMAPEQMRGKEVDARADQFSFCVSLHEALFGDRPFPPGPMGNLAQMLEREPSEPSPNPAGRRVPRWLLRAITRGLASDPEDRWPSMEALIDTLDRHRRRHSLRWVGVATVSLGLAVGAAVWLSPTPPAPAEVPPCRGAADPVRDLWSEDQRADVRTAILSGDVAYARATWAPMERELDTYAQRLRGAYTEACEATKVRFEQTGEDLQLRRTCLDERASRMRQTISLLQEADAQVVERGVELVVALPGIDACTDVEALRRAAPAAPADAEAQQQLQLLRERLGEARVLATAGKTTEGLAAIDPVLIAAKSHEDPALLAEAQLVQGNLLADLGSRAEAVERLDQALEGALEQGADAIAVEILSTLTYLVGVDQAKTEAGLWIGRMAEGLVDRADPEGLAKAQVLTARSQVWASRGELARAQVGLEQALTLLRRAVGEDHIALAQPLDSLGVVLRQQGQLERAHTQYQRALEIRIRWQGQQHPETAHQRINLGVVLEDEGKPEQAQQQWRLALEILDADPVERHELIAHARLGLGTSLATQQRFEEARQQLELSVDAWQSAYGPTHPNVAAACMALGGALWSLEHHSDAAAQYERALRIFRANEINPDSQAKMIQAHQNLERLYERLGQRSDVAAHRAAVLALQPEGAPSPATASRSVPSQDTPPSPDAPSPATVPPRPGDTP